MKTEKDFMRALTEHNRFIRAVLCKILNYSIIAIISIVFLAIGLSNIRQPVGEFFAYVGGGVALVLIFLVLRSVNKANKINDKITEYEKNTVGTIEQTKEKKEKNKNGIIW